MGGARGERGLEEGARIAAAVVVVEPDRRRALADELEVEVGRPAEEVAEETAVAVDLVEARVGLDADGRARRDQPPQQRAGLGAVALASPQLRRVDLDEPDVLRRSPARPCRRRSRTGSGRTATGRPRPGRERPECQDETEQDESAPHRTSVGSATPMRLEHIFDLDLRYEGEYVVVRPYGGLDGAGYAAGTGRATGPRVEGSVRFSNNPRVRGDGVLLADLAGAIATDDGARIVFSLTGLGRKNENGRSFDVALAMTLESDDERYEWANEALCVARRDRDRAAREDAGSPFARRGHVGFGSEESCDRDHDRDSTRPARAESRGSRLPPADHGAALHARARAG